MPERAQLQPTIFALATPAAPSPMALIRISGPLVAELAVKLSGLSFERSSKECTVALPLGAIPATVWILPAPKTLTCEDTLELRVPGNPAIVRQLEERLRGLGCRDAEPGEFTRRALDAGKLDLTRAEGVLQLVSATDETTRRQAIADLSGETSLCLDGITERLRAVSARFEMLFDFSEEEHANAEEATLRSDLADLINELDCIAISDAGRPKRETPVVALFGPPNAGKSTLFNALLGKPRSLVSDSPGTTRDPVVSEVHLGTHTANLLDLSGVGQSDTDRGRYAETARKQALQADLLLVLDAPEGDDVTPAFELLEGRDPDIRSRAIWLHTKSDLGHASGDPCGLQELSVSGLSGGGLDTLRECLALRLDQLASGGATSLLRVRAGEALKVLACVEPTTPPEVIASDVRRALKLLDEARLAEAPGEVLSLIFSRFCIGK